MYACGAHQYYDSCLSCVSPNEICEISGTEIFGSAGRLCRVLVLNCIEARLTRHIGSGWSPSGLAAKGETRRTDPWYWDSITPKKRIDFDRSPLAHMSTMVDIS